jgi:acetyl-CoA carboxylase biotin carboxyl carrier protein
VELKQIKELMGAMGRSGITKLVLKEGGFELQLEREGGEGFERSGMPMMGAGMLETDTQRPPFAFVKHPDLPPTQEAPLTSASSPAVDENSKFVTSPMVGTYYAAPSPDDPVFVKVGDRIEPNTVVCIVEAMKVMNEVKAGVSGVVTEVLLNNGHPVEFGTKIFRVI